MKKRFESERCAEGRGHLAGLSLLAATLLCVCGTLVGVRGQAGRVRVATPPARPVSEQPEQKKQPAAAPAEPATTTWAFEFTQTRPASTPQSPLPSRGPRVPRAVAPVPPAGPAPAAPPKQVITVVHRLSGWRLLTLLASSGAPRIVGVEDLPKPTDVHTNIVAGFVSDDGRTVVACLPQAEAEAESVFQMPGLLGDKEAASFGPGNSEIFVVRNDGAQFKARFIGLDGSTGLSFLEVEKPVLPPSAPEVAPAAAPAAAVINEGQHVWLFGPAPINPTNASGIVGETGETDEVVYAQMGVVEGQLTDVQRAPSGKVVQAAVRAQGLSPAWTGSVAINPTGHLVGILTQTGGEMRLVSSESVRGAMARVLARRASVPKPWLGARGDAVSLTPLSNFISNGWTPERAMALLNKRQGVLLTSVAPGTPAALAGLRPGDVVARVSESDIKGIEDFSLLLREAGGGSTLNFTVLRAEALTPLKLSVTLSGAPNPASATHEAELRASEERLRLSLHHERIQEAKARTTYEQALAALERARGEMATARAAGNLKRFEEAQKSVVEAMLNYEAAQKSMNEAARRVEQALKAHEDAQTQLSKELRARGSFYKLQLIEGMDAIGISTKLAARFHAQGGLLVVSIAPGSPAEATGLKVGDVIETLGGVAVPPPDQSFDFQFRWSWKEKPNSSLGVVRGGQKLVLKYNENSKQ